MWVVRRPRGPDSKALREEGGSSHLAFVQFLNDLGTGAARE
jgi:hypothetical protein